MEFEPTKLLAKIFSPLKRIPYLPILVDEQLKIFTLFFRPKVFQQMIEIVKWLKSLPGVKSKYHKYGGLEFQVNGKEICHIHGDGLTDILLNKSRALEIIKRTNSEEHHVIQNSGWISYQIKANTKTSELKEIIKESYEQRYSES